MPSWYLKAALQGLMSLTSDPQRWNRLFQEHVTRSLDLAPSFFEEKWAKCKRHLEAHPASVSELSILELGTGWHPVVPIGMALSGAKAVYTVDVQSLLDRRPVADVVSAYYQCGDPALDRPRVEAAMGACQDADASGEDLLRAAGVTPLIADARKIPLPAGSIDLFSSNNTFEHIPEAVLVEILQEFRRLATDSAVMSHHVDMADHYVNFDRSITVFNFLRFSERTWRLFNNTLQYQNRLRFSDYLRIHERAGWLVEDTDTLAESRETLESVPLAPPFQSYDIDDLRIYDAWFRSTKSQ